MKSGFFKSSDRLNRSLLFLFLFALLSIMALIPPDSVSKQIYSQSDVFQTIKHPNPPSHLQIIAVMVEFQPDSNRFTSGNGTFNTGSIPYLESPGTNIDALPHDREYFEAHLKFAENYFYKVSNGALIIDSQVLPNIYRLDHQMEYYSPTGLDPELNPLAQLVHDTWEKVSADPDPGLLLNRVSGQEFVFIIFHAGIGRDIELTGTSLDRTPQDIPSAYLNSNALRELLNDPSFSGFEIDKGNLLVDHSIILPRTLSRQGEDLAGNQFVLPISINGLLTAQLGGRIGMPFLFNTATGESGIGRFGLMDGAGIFSYNGLFPPEPSAWEKIYMGWAEPDQIDYNHPEPVHLQASTPYQVGDIAKVSISQNEYFLIENRHRDPDGMGVELTIRRPDGSIVRQHFSNDDIDFTRQMSGFDQLLEPGVIIDVNHYDFSLPGGRISQTVNGQPSETVLNGGILVWHIDESVIRAGLPSNSVNNNPGHRGVELKEADSAQDIGKPVATGLFQNEVHGSPFDFWWSGNNASVVIQGDTLSLYENRFGPGSNPDNRSHSGALSHFELYDFSDNLPVASFEIRQIDPFESLYSLILNETLDVIIPYSRLNDEFQSRYPLAINRMDSDNGSCILIPGQNGFYITNILDDTCPNRFFEADQPQQPLMLPGISGFAVAEHLSSSSGQIALSVYRYQNSEIQKKHTFNLMPSRGFISLSEPNIIDIDGTPQRVDILNRSILENDTPVQRSETISGTESRIEGNMLLIRFPGGEQSHPMHSDFSEMERLHTGLIQSGSSSINAYLLSDGKLTLYSSEDQFQIPVLLSDADLISWPAFADLNQDGYPEILFLEYDSGLLLAKNRQGAMVSGFPVSPASGHQFTGIPLVADINGNGAAEIIIQSEYSNRISLFAYNLSGDLVEGFPLHVGGVSEPSMKQVQPLLVDRYLVAVSPDGDLKTWLFPQLQDIQWASAYGTVFNNKVTGRIDRVQIPDPGFTLLNPDETYNWPNPARNETYIRFETTGRAQIRIKITTLSGRLIHDQTVQARGFMPEEIPLDTSGWPSGAYFALIEASDGSQKENKLVKIAIIR